MTKLVDEGSPHEYSNSPIKKYSCVNHYTKQYYYVTDPRTVTQKINAAREAYIQGRIELHQFESQLDTILGLA